MERVDPGASETLNSKPWALPRTFSKGFGRDSDAQLRNVPFQKSPYKTLTPLERSGVIRRQERARKPAPAPQAVLVLDADLAQIEAAEVNEAHAPRQRFGNAFDQRRRGAAQNQKPPFFLSPHPGWDAFRTSSQPKREKTPAGCQRQPARGCRGFTGVRPAAGRASGR